MQFHNVIIKKGPMPLSYYFQYFYKLLENTFPINKKIVNVQIHSYLYVTEGYLSEKFSTSRNSWNLLTLFLIIIYLKKSVRKCLN